MYRVSKNPYMTTPTPLEVLQSGFILEENRSKFLRVRAIKSPFGPERWEYMANGFMCNFHRGMFYLCTDEPESDSEYSTRTALEGYGMLHYGVAGVLGAEIVKGIRGFFSINKKLDRAFESENTFAFPYTDIVGVEVHKFGGFFGKFKCVTIGLEVDEGDYESTYWIEAPGNDDNWAKLFMIMKFEDEKNNFYHSYLMKETESFGSTFKAMTEGKDDDEMTEDEVVDVMLKSEAAALEELSSRGVSKEDIQNTWVGLAERFEHIIF